MRLSLGKVATTPVSTEAPVYFVHGSFNTSACWTEHLGFQKAYCSPSYHTSGGHEVVVISLNKTSSLSLLSAYT